MRLNPRLFHCAMAIVAMLSSLAFAQPSGGGGTSSAGDATLASLSWLGNFYTELSGLPFNSRRSSLGLVASGEDAYDIYAFDVRHYSDAIAPIGACNVVERHDVPVIDLPDSEAEIYGLISVRNWFGIFVVTTSTGYSGVVLGLVTDFVYPSSTGVTLSCSRILPLSDHDTVSDAQDSLLYWAAPFLEDLGAIDACSGVDPNTPFGRYCKCTKDARDEAFQEALIGGGMAFGGLAACLGGIACGPAAPLCVGGCGLLVFGGFGMHTYANIHDFHADMYTCAWNLCAEDPNYPCP